MKNIQKKLIIFATIINFANIYTKPTSDHQKTSKKVSFNEATIIRTYQYEAEENDPTEWITEKDQQLAIQDLRSETNLTRQEYNQQQNNHTHLIKLKNAQTLIDVRNHWASRSDSPTQQLSNKSNSPRRTFFIKNDDDDDDNQYDFAFALSVVAISAVSIYYIVSFLDQNESE